MIKLKGVGHVNLRVADQEISKRFYRDILGFAIAEEDPDHGGVFMTLGENFHTLDIGQHPSPDEAQRPQRGQIGLGHIASSGRQLRRPARCLHASGSERRRHHARHERESAKLLLRGPGRQHIEIYYEMPHALQLFADGRSDDDEALPVSSKDEPLPTWLFEDWPGPEMEAVGATTLARPAQRNARRRRRRRAPCPGADLPAARSDDCTTARRGRTLSV